MIVSRPFGAALLAAGLGACGSGDRERVAQLEEQLMAAKVELEVMRQERDEAIEKAKRRSATPAPSAPPSSAPAAGGGGLVLPAAAPSSSAVIAITSATAGVTEQNNSRWRYAWRAEIRNTTSNPQTYEGSANFLDDNSLTVDDDYIPRGTLAPGATLQLDGDTTVRLPGAARVGAVEIVIDCEGGPVRYRLDAGTPAPAPQVVTTTTVERVRVPSSAPASPTTRAPRVRPAELASYSSPRITVVDYVATVTGTVYNRGDEPYRGRVTVTVIVDGRDDRSVQVDVTVPPNGSAPVTAVINRIGRAEHRYDARLSW